MRSLCIFVFCVALVFGAVAPLRKKHKHGAERCARDVEPQRPNILYIMMDDVGTAGVGFSARHNQALVKGSTETFFEAQFAGFTPTLDALAANGVQLNRMYAYAECTPSRQSLLSGRLPVHNGVIMRDADRWDGGLNIDNGYDGLSPNITTFARKLQLQGYATHVVGKQDGFGMATRDHLAVSEKRGFDTSMGYFNHANGPWNYTLNQASIGAPPPCLETYDKPYVIDMMVNTPQNPQSLRATQYYNCSNAEEDPTKACEYQELVFTKRILDLIDNSSPKDPWFIWYSSHLAHTPMATPEQYYTRILELCGPNATDERFRGQCVVEERQRYLASIMMFDDNVSRILARLKERGLYDNTLIVFTSDNGSGIGQAIGGNNWPNRGGKASLWEGGLRIPAFVGGGYLPAARRGTKYDFPVALSDWYATFCTLAGGDICTGPGADPTGEQVPGIVPVESVNLWPYLMGENTAPPHLLLHTAPTSLLKVEPKTGKIYKLLTGITGSNMLTSPNYPNCTIAKIPAALCPPENDLGPCLDDNSTLCCAFEDSGPVCDPPTIRPASGNPFEPPSIPSYCGNGCLYEITDDYSESNDLSTEPAYAGLLLQMQSLLFTLNQTYYEPFRGCDVPQVLCPAAINHWNETFGPFLNIDGCEGCVFTTDEYRMEPNPPVPRTTNQCQCYTTERDCNENNSTCSWYAARDQCDLVDDLTWADYLVLRRFSPQFYDNYAELFD